MFNVTFEIVTHESAERGENAEAGFLAQGVTLREAYSLLKYKGSATAANVWPLREGSVIRWLTFDGNGFDAYGECESYALHLPESTTPASRLRIARLFGLKKEPTHAQD